MKDESISFTVKTQSLSLRLLLPPHSAEDPPEPSEVLDAAVYVMAWFTSEKDILDAFEKRLTWMRKSPHYKEN